MTVSESLLKQLYVSLKEYDNAHNAFRANPSDKSFDLYEKKERKLLLIEQKVREYLDENNIEYNIDLCKK